MEGAGANALVEAGRFDDALAEVDTELSMAPGHSILLATKGAVLVGAREEGQQPTAIRVAGHEHEAGARTDR